MLYMPEFFYVASKVFTITECCIIGSILDLLYVQISDCRYFMLFHITCISSPYLFFIYTYFCRSQDSFKIEFSLFYRSMNDNIASSNRTIGMLIALIVYLVSYFAILMLVLITFANIFVISVFRF